MAKGGPASTAFSFGVNGARCDSDSPVLPDLLSRIPEGDDVGTLSAVCGHRYGLKR